MVDWGDEVKPRARHSGRLGIDSILKDARRGDLKAVQAHFRKDPTLLLDKSLGHNRTFLWEATRGNRAQLVKFLLKAGADPNVPGRIRSEIPVLLKPYCIALRYRRPELAELLRGGTTIDIYSACFLGQTQKVQQILRKDSRWLTREQDDDTVWRVTALHHAVCGGHESLVHWLIEQGAKVAPYTRLLCNGATRMKHPHLLRLLLDAGADPELARLWSRP